MKFGVSNLRRLKDVKPIDIRPITLLVGRNSGGKSTYLRSLPLIRQSIQTRTSSPILWFGDLVDFGSHDESISKGSSGGAISFSFEDVISVRNRNRMIYTMDGHSHYWSNGKTDYGVTRYSADIIQASLRNRISKIRISFDNIPDQMELHIGEAGVVNKIYISGRDVTSHLSPHRMSITLDSLFPHATFPKKSADRDTPPWYGFVGDIMVQPIFDIIRRRTNGRVRDQTIKNFSERVIIDGAYSEALLTRQAQGQSDTLKGVISNILKEDPSAWCGLKYLILISNVPNMLRDLSEHFRKNLSTTLYIGPARARSERYYRYQDLAVNEIDSDGKNFPIFLNSLSKGRQESFSKWVHGLYGYSVSVSQKSGHISITLSDRGVDANIVDVGYGISQVLPVLGQLWWAREKFSSKSQHDISPILAIEQPELHLHPAHQAILADAIIDILQSKSDEPPVRFLIETHSETLINRLGRMIAKGRLKKEDIHIAIFESKNDLENTEVRTSEYNDKGALLDWPYGFFLPDN